MAATGASEGGTGAAPARAVIPAYVPPSDFQSDVPLHDGFALAPDVLQPVAQRFAFEAGIGIAANLENAFTAEAQEAQRRTEAAVPDTGHPREIRAEPGATATSIATLKPIGQVSSSFIVAVNGEGLWIVDQHVAHERILFEKHLRARQEGGVGGQRLLMPIVAELSPRQLVLFEQIAEELRANGFEIEPIGPRSVAVQAAPAGIAADDAEKLLRQILDGIERENQAISMESLQAKIAATTACHAAIKVNMPLDQTKMEWLLAELAKTDAPMSCPHGRPVVLRYSVREIEKAFKRI
jgi:DNA mismatch repair protein MutL